MLEDFYDSIKAIIYHELPKNSNGDVIIRDQIIKGWYYGERTIEPESPAIAIQGKSSNYEDIATFTKKIEYDYKISIGARLDNRELVERDLLEYARIMNEALYKHRRIWALPKCPICELAHFTPLHYLSISPATPKYPAIDHAYVLQDYIQMAYQNFINVWNETHITPPPTSMLFDSGIGAAAFNLFYNAVSSSGTLEYGNLYTSASADIINRVWLYKIDKLVPIHIMTNCRVTDVSLDNAEGDNVLYKWASFSLKGQEIRIITDIGPDNVDLGAYPWVIR